MKKEIKIKSKIGAPKNNKNNKKKEEWHCFTSRASMVRQLDAVVLPTLDYLQIPSTTMNFLREDILGFVNRECRAVKNQKAVGYNI